MRIVIDMQGVQTESRFRGIGRYTLSLAQAIVRNRGEQEIILAMSGLFPDTIEPVRAAFEGLLSQENIRVWSAPGRLDKGDSGGGKRHEVSELIREAFLASLRPDIVHVSSLFEGFFDEAVTSIGVFAPKIPTVVTLYDLTPLLNPEAFFSTNPSYERYYQKKIEYLKRADQWLAISEASAREGLARLSLPADSVFNLSAACDAVFQPIEIREDEKRSFLGRFNIDQPFLLYSGSGDPHKNLHRLIHAYQLLPKMLRETHQLVMAGRISVREVTELVRIAKMLGLRQSSLVFTGYVPDEELARLYNLCAVFVFPSLCEGFGLPALEAMACGAAVIGSNSTSVPEVIGRSDALFDPYDEDAIARKIFEVLTKDDFRAELKRYGRERAKKFSWDESAQRAIAAYEALYAKRLASQSPVSVAAYRPKLAYVSPLPPERSGISDYSAELLPALSKYYDIEVVLAQKTADNSCVPSNGPVRDPQWLRANAHRMERVLYQFGNSPFHQHMLSLLEDVPGTVVLHDFFLSNLLAYLEERELVPQAWTQALYDSHGYSAVKERYRAKDSTDVLMKYPANLQVLQRAQGVIVHSRYSHGLAVEWYGKDFSEDWKVVPLLRTPSSGSDRVQSRASLGLKIDDFVVCSFGFLDPVKLNHRLLQAWMNSRMAQDASCVLVFVGQSHATDYANHLAGMIRSNGLEKRIRITGWVDVATFRNYLATADMAVQLRTLSRGETSAAVLDCMNHGLPIIVNANGFMGGLPSDSVWRLPDVFEDRQLIEVLETLWRDGDRRAALGKRAQEVVRSQHTPQSCAEQYAEAIEKFHALAQSDSHSLVKAIVGLEGYFPSDAECRILAKKIAETLPFKQAVKRLFLDISATRRNGLKTGIERVVRALVAALLDAPPAGYRVEPVYLSDEGGVWHYRYARRYTLGFLECPLDVLADDVVEPRNGDVLVGLDLSGPMLSDAEASGLFANYRNVGVRVYYMVHDLLPVQRPEFFPLESEGCYEQWLRAIAKFDGAVGVSKTVADDFREWLRTNGLQPKPSFRMAWSHHGADVDNSVPTQGFPGDAQRILSRIRACPSFLMVGTLEPRKGHLQTLEAFADLWRKGLDVNLVIVGAEGWKDLPKEKRRTIPGIVSFIRNHPEFNERLFWLEAISDEYLGKIYCDCTCLIAASEGEGFGLPLIEAAERDLPIIARDIPVFREVAGEHAFYFRGLAPTSLADAIKNWLMLNARGEAPPSGNMSRLTWKQSAQQLLRIILPGGL